MELERRARRRATVAPHPAASAPAPVEEAHQILLPVALAAALIVVAGGLTLLGVDAAPTRRPAAPAQLRLGRVVAPPEGARLLGVLASKTPIRLDIVLRPAGGLGLEQLAIGVSTPTSPDFRHYLSVEAFADRFAPSTSTRLAVSRALGHEGLGPFRLLDGGLILSAATNAGAVERAFSLRLLDYVMPDHRTAYGADRPPLVATSIAGSVLYLSGLTSFDLPRPEGVSGVSGHRSAPAVTHHGAASAPVACAAAESTGGMTAPTLARAYDVGPLYARGDLGAKVSVAVFELEPFAANDIRRYQACYGTHAEVRRLAVDGGAGAGAGSGEAASDIESLISVAPDVRVLVVEGPYNESGVIDTYAKMVDDAPTKVISTSWGVCEAELSPGLAQAENLLFEQAATEGQSVISAAGDHGSEDCADSWASGENELSVSDPASQPFVTGVGGTSFTHSGGALHETVWNVPGSFGGAGGGGASVQWPEPSWQQGLVSGTSGRLVPDVSAFANSSVGDAVVIGGQWTTYGGTSTAAPLWAGLVALADSSPSCAGRSVGAVDPSLYALAGRSYSSYFHDITAGGNDYLGLHPGAFRATTGFDEASGLGSPIAARLVPALCEVTQ